VKLRPLAEPSTEQIDAWEIKSPDHGWSARRAALLSIAFALAPIVVATIRALVHHWVPVGDDAFFDLRAHDVFTRNNPQLGAWTSASLTAGIDFNQPGPLLFDVLAVPARLFGYGAGVAVGAAAVNVASVLGIAAFARRRGGDLAVTVTMAVTAALAWSMGSELLYEPWNPHIVLLPVLFLLVLAWSLACGDAVALPWAVITGSFIVQAHLSYGLIVPTAVLWGVAAGIVEIRRRWAFDADNRPALRRRLRRSLTATGVVVLLAWAQPIAEQFTSPGRGNLSRIAGSIGSSGTTVGAGLAARVVATAVLLPPWWLRPSFEQTLAVRAGTPPGTTDFATITHVASRSGALIAFALLAAVLVAAALVARVRRDRIGGTALGTALVSLGASFVSAAKLPIGLFVVAPHQLRFLWPVGAFLVAALLVVASRAIAGAAAPDTLRVRSVAIGLATVAVVIGILALPTYNPKSGPTADAASGPVVRDLLAQLGPLDNAGTVLFDLRNERFAEPYSEPIMARLARAGVPFLVQGEGMVRQVGERRRFTGTADARIFMLEGDATDAPPPGAGRVAFATALTDAERAELQSLRDQVALYITGNGVPLNDDGRRFVATGLAPELAREQTSGNYSADSLLTSRDLVALQRLGGLDLPSPWNETFARYASLQERWDHLTVGVYLAPVDGPPPPGAGG
jgi:hypothetical protein